VVALIVVDVVGLGAGEEVAQTVVVLATSKARSRPLNKGLMASRGLDAIVDTAAQKYF